MGLGGASCTFRSGCCASKYHALCTMSSLSVYVHSCSHLSHVIGTLQYKSQGMVHRSTDSSASRALGFMGLFSASQPSHDLHYGMWWISPLSSSQNLMRLQQQETPPPAKGEVCQCAVCACVSLHALGVCVCVCVCVCCVCVCMCVCVCVCVCVWCVCVCVCVCVLGLNQSALGCLHQDTTG